jgi:hypothetical protein
MRSRLDLLVPGSLREPKQANRSSSAARSPISHWSHSLRIFTGVFRSDEIDRPYGVIIKDGHLVV